MYLFLFYLTWGAASSVFDIRRGAGPIPSTVQLRAGPIPRGVGRVHPAGQDPSIKSATNARVPALSPARRSLRSTCLRRASRLSTRDTMLPTTMPTSNG